MHPAYSVILFTVLSGAGYGLLALAGLTALAHGPASSFEFGLVVMLTGLGLATAGLLSSTLHLGHPERAWRAFSQWRSSWLSREGVAAMATYAPALIFGWLWVTTADVSDPMLQAFAVLMIAMCVLTVVCTAMIYASLRTVRQWRTALVPAVYVTMAFATGAPILLVISTCFERLGALFVLTILSIVPLLTTIVLKHLYWRKIDAEPRDLTMSMATGLPGPVRQWEAAHTARNFVLQEMGYRVARRHARRLRQLALGLLAVAILLMISVAWLESWLAFSAAVAAALATFAGALIERWLFFAEAQHVSSLYFGAEKA